MATNIGYRVDTEMTSFTATVHIDNLERFAELFIERLAEPAFAREDLERERQRSQSTIVQGLRNSDDEELGREVLYSRIFTGHPYGHHTGGHVRSLGSLRADELRAFHAEHYRHPLVGIAGGYSGDFERR